MKSQFVLSILLITLSMASGFQADTKEKFTALLQVSTSAHDAVDSALQVLRDLKQVNIDAQARSDEFNASQEHSCQKTINSLTNMATSNKEIATEGTAKRKFYQQETQDTIEYLAWIEARREELIAKQEELEAQRCYANNVFIRQLQETAEAIEVTKLLRDELIPFSSQEKAQAAELVDLSSFTDAFSKIKAISHLFSEKAMAEFAQLEEDQAWVDNDREGLEVENFESGTDARNLKKGLGDKLIQMLNDLEVQLQATIDELQVHELAAAKQFVTWLIDTEKEQMFLDAEEARKKTYREKLEIGFIVAQAHEDKSWEIYYESAAALQSGIEECDAKRAAYASEKAIRDDENSILDDILRTFINQVQVVDNKIRQHMN